MVRGVDHEATQFAARRAIAGRRVELGLTQREVADRIGMSRQWVTAFETGTQTLTLPALIDFCIVLEMPLAEMLRRAPETDLRALGLTAGEG